MIKTAITTIIGLSIVISIGFWVKQTCNKTEKFPSTPVNGRTALESIETLLDAIRLTESGGDVNAIGDKGRAIGVYQIWKIYVDDVNRILRIKHTDRYSAPLQFDYSNRKNPYLSRFMVKTYLNYYATKERIGRKPTFEDMARMHVSGPNGYKKQCSLSYWLKVKAVLENVKE